MNRDVLILLVTQFLGAFADNAILFTALAKVMQSPGTSPGYVPALQALFLAAFVVLGPWVGPYADSHPKSHVLSMANAIKALGAGLMFIGLEPLLAYTVVGIGAALYGPAKYGALPELVGPEQLVKANGWIEGTTIVAMLTGSLGGATLADHSVPLALGIVALLFITAAFTARFITSVPPQHIEREPPFRHYQALISGLLHTHRARFCVLGVALFWGTTAALRLMLMDWAPAVLGVSNSEGVAELTVYIALGTAGGALLVPRLIPLHALRRARFPGYAIGLTILLLATIHIPWLARGVLFPVGLMAGLFVVPLNAALQDIGHHSVGSGNTIAVQQFFESLAMTLASGLYAVAVKTGASPVTSLQTLGLLVLVVTFLVSRRLSRTEN